MERIGAPEGYRRPVLADNGLGLAASCELIAGGKNLRMSPNLVSAPYSATPEPATPPSGWRPTPLRGRGAGRGSSHRSRTFEVEGHHYALVRITDLKPDSSHEYAAVCWTARGSGRRKATDSLRP